MTTSVPPRAAPPAAALLAAVLMLGAGCSRFDAPGSPGTDEPAAPPPPSPERIVDYNGNGLDDQHELRTGFTPDANGNKVPDDLERWEDLPYQHNCMVVFGDSLSDTGNMFARYGSPASPPNFMGRYSNGPVWVEYLAKLMGMGTDVVFDYAYGGATTGRNNASRPGAPGLQDEIDYYLRKADTLRLAGANPLFVLWIGSNDFDGAQILGPIVDRAMRNIDTAIARLTDAGARRFLVVNAPDLSRTPHVSLLHDAEFSRKARIATLAFNASLAWRLAQAERARSIDIVYYDFYSLFEQIVADPPRFGFTDVASPCLPNEAQPPCANPASYVFWDGLHPTTAGHRVIALGAQVALATGGAPLPELDLMPIAGEVRLDAGLHGTFTDQAAVDVQGTAYSSGDATLLVNGVPTPIASNGRFAATVPMIPGVTEQPIVAILSSGDRVLDRDRIVVFRGPSLGAGEPVADAIVARLTPPGLADVRDQILHELLTNGKLDIRRRLLRRNPLDIDTGGGAQHVVNIVDAGFSTATLEIEPRQGRLFVQLNLHDVHIDWHADISTIGIPSNCDGHLFAGYFGVFAEFAVLPGAIPGTIEVQQLTPLQLDHQGFFETYDCDPIGWLVVRAANRDLSGRQKLFDSIDMGLRDANDRELLEVKLEDLFARLPLSQGLSTALGVPVNASISQVGIAPSLLSAGVHMAIGSTSSNCPRTVAIPHSGLSQSALDPSGNGFDLAASIALSSINQVLTARMSQFLPQRSITAMDLGEGLQPLTAGRLATFLPALRHVDPSLPLALRVRATLPPMLLGSSGSSAGHGVVSDLYVGQLLIEVADATVPAGATYLAVAMDVRGLLRLGFDAPAGALTAALEPTAFSCTIVDNQLQLPETLVQQLLGALAPELVGSAPQIQWDVSDIAGVALTPSFILAENGYASVYCQAATLHGRPDLIVTRIDAPPVIDRHLGFSTRVAFRNVGTTASHGGFEVRAFLSLGPTLDRFDPMMAVQFYPMSGIEPGGTFEADLWVNAVPGIAADDQWLFVCVDVNQVPGSAGWIWESHERNNFGSTTVFTTDPDAYVTSVQCPTDVVGGDLDRAYRVRVGRNEVGADTMPVPVRLNVANLPPVVVWVQVPRGQEIDVDIFSDTPPAFGPPGASQQFPVTASTTLIDDSNRDNDSVATSLWVAAPWWDLSFRVLGPTSAASGSIVTWEVEVTNVGNVWSYGRCGLTGIVLYPGRGVFQPGYTWSFSIPPLPPARFATSPGQNTFRYTTPPTWLFNATRTNQYLKAELQYNQGCLDDPLSGDPNDFDQRVIYIY